MGTELILSIQEDSLNLWLKNGGQSAWGSVRSPKPLDAPLTSDQLGEIRWYLEDYLHSPYGAFNLRAKKIERALEVWGEALFHVLFGNPDSVAIYDAAKELSDDGFQLTITSDDPAWLAIPWELIREPGSPFPLSQTGCNIVRNLPGLPLLDGEISIDTRALRILLIIARPQGIRDVEYHIIARPLLQRLRLSRLPVELHVLRPPTLEALNTTLQVAKEQGSAFQVVHFDGHGGMIDAHVLSQVNIDDAGTSQANDQGVLVFERLNAQGVQLVSARELAAILLRHDIKVVLMNACESGSVGREIEATVAIHLLKYGVGSVIAMAYRVYAVAAAEFVSTFYESLLAGETIAEAVTAGRLQMFNHSDRVSPRGPLPLQDWIVPVLYSRNAGGGVALTDPLEPMTKEFNQSVAIYEDEMKAFIGRDSIFYLIETAFATKKIVILHGLTGSGKTTFAKSFVQWWKGTSALGRENATYLYCASQESGQRLSVASFINIINNSLIDEMPERTYGSSDLDLTVQVLSGKQTLLVWDDFGEVTKLHLRDGKRAYEEAMRTQDTLLRLLSVVTDCHILILCNSPGRWLGRGATDIERIQLPRMTAEEISLLVQQSRQGIPDLKVGTADYDLIDALQGHPESIKAILPVVGDVKPLHVLRELTGRSGWGGARGIISPESPLDAAILAKMRSILSNLTERAQRALPLLTIFHGYVDNALLKMIETRPGVPDRFSLSSDEWDLILAEAVSAGLLTEIITTYRGGFYSFYDMHPQLNIALRYYGSTSIDTTASQELNALQGTFLSMYLYYALVLHDEMASDETAGAVNVIEYNISTFEFLLEYGLERQEFEPVHSLLQTLTRYWEIRGKYLTANAWNSKIRSTLIEKFVSEDAFTVPVRTLWVYCLSTQANRDLAAGLFDDAEAGYLEIARLQGSVSPPIRYMLGKTAAARGNIDMAVVMFQEAASEFEKSEDWASASNSYGDMCATFLSQGRRHEAYDVLTKSVHYAVLSHNPQLQASALMQLGAFNGEGGNHDDAARCFAQAVSIYEQIEHPPELVKAYFNLGGALKLSNRLDEALDWLASSLNLAQQLSDGDAIARACESIGDVTEALGHDEEAESWFKEALKFWSSATDGDQGAVRCYHRLGNLAKVRGNIQGALELYETALTKSRNTGDSLPRAIVFLSLSAIHEQAGDSVLALDNAIRASAVFDLKASPPPYSDFMERLRATRQERSIREIEERWLYLTGSLLPATIRDRL